ncbi:MAG: hypothetical protein EP329_14690 [Deltaproteobacteria bacterium]|nr:MAG: hypothetical protein EP329_14690 [Deltaproteobacteria bacterium]
MRMRKMITLLPLATLLVACGPGFDENTGGDGSRGEAREVRVDGPVDDRVSAEQGDNTDWKKFELEDTAKVTVHFWWDEPSVAVSMTIRDELGQKLTAMKHGKGQREEQLGPIKLKAGAYFLEISASDGASVYTFEIQTGSGGGGAPTPDF